MPDERHEDDAPPSVDALVAGTVALMTIWADPCPHCTVDLASQRAAVARKVASNLFILQHHAGLGEGLRAVMGMAHQRWRGLAESRASREAPAEAAPAAAAAAALH